MTDVLYGCFFSVYSPPPPTDFCARAHFCSCLATFSLSLHLPAAGKGAQLPNRRKSKEKNEILFPKKKIKRQSQEDTFWLSLVDVPFCLYQVDRTVWQGQQTESIVDTCSDSSSNRFFFVIIQFTFHSRHLNLKL